jgi:hypothetical protein
MCPQLFHEFVYKSWSNRNQEFSSVWIGIADTFVHVFIYSSLLSISLDGLTRATYKMIATAQACNWRWKTVITRFDLVFMGFSAYLALNPSSLHKQLDMAVRSASSSVQNIRGSPLYPPWNFNFAPRITQFPPVSISLLMARISYHHRYVYRE